MEGHGFRPSPNFKHMKKYQKAKAHLSTLIEDTPPIIPAQETKTVPQPFELPPKEVKQEPCLMPPPQPYEDLPPQPYEDLPPHPYEDLPPHPYEDLPPQLYEDLPPQLYEDLPPQPYEDMPPQPYENQPPLPPDIKPPLIDFKPPLPIVMQPPLPPHPPPAGIKREMNESEMEYLGASQQSTEYMDYEEMMPVENQPEEVMCRNFIRGICTRGSACIFSHKLIMSQLKDVYRFCNDFQNSICKRPRCRFVHASVFEKQKFLRTGYLPEHTIAHMTENISVLPPPPPPPEEPSVPMYYSMVPPPPPPPVTESVQASTDSMMMYAPGPSGYQASMQGQMQASHSSMQTSMPTTVQPVQTQIHDPLQAMQTSIINPSQAIQALMRNPPPTTMRAPSQASSNLRAKQSQAQVMQTTSQVLRTAQMMKTSMQAPTQTMHASMHATPQPMQTSSQMMHSVSQMMPAPMQAPSQTVQASVQMPAQGMQVLMQTPSQSMHVSMQVPPPSMHVPPPTMQVPPPTMQVPPPTMQSTMQASHQTMQSPMHTSFQVMQSPIQASLQPIQTVSPQVQTGIDIYANPMPGTSSSTNTGWPQYEPSPSTSYEQVTPTVRSSTSCSSCDINDFRLKYNINKNEKLRRENEEMDRKLAELAVKKQVIYIFLAKIFKSNRSWCTTATADVDRQRALMEQLTALLSAGDL